MADALLSPKADSSSDNEEHYQKQSKHLHHQELECGTDYWDMGQNMSLFKILSLLVSNTKHNYY